MAPRVGLVGGLGPESTIDYYRRVIEVWRESSHGSAPCIVIDSLDVDLGIHLLSIVDVCAEEASRRGYAIVGLLGTRFTMEASLYPDVFLRRSIKVVVPTEVDRSWLHERYIGELLRGVFRDETRDGVVAMITRLRESAGIDAIVLGGTELPLLLKVDSAEGLPTMDTTELHVRAIVQRLLSLSSA